MTTAEQLEADDQLDALERTLEEIEARLAAELSSMPLDETGEIEELLRICEQSRRLRADLGAVDHERASARHSAGSQDGLKIRRRSFTRGRRHHDA